MLYGLLKGMIQLVNEANVLILIFLENALRRLIDGVLVRESNVLILIFLENALRHVLSQLGGLYDA